MNPSAHTTSPTAAPALPMTPAAFGSDRVMKIALVGALLSVAVALMPSGAQAQEAWRGLTIPNYSNATELTVSQDEDEYEISFKSEDEPKQIFDFYVDYLQQQGFKVTKTKTKKDGYKADMQRDGGGRNNMVELDVKNRHGRHEVEIEFDD